MKAIDMTNVQEAGDYKRPVAGPYICTITAVEDVTAKEYLKVSYDIAEGDLKGYYTALRTDHPDWAWAGAYCKSYKEAALGMFKRFCSAVSKSNGNFVFDGGMVNADEKSLIGKKIGLLFQEEEYYGNDGNKKTRLVVKSEFPIGEIDNQKIPKKKELAPDTAEIANAGTDTDAEEIPF